MATQLIQSRLKQTTEKREKLKEWNETKNENDFYSKMMKPNHLLALKEITKLYGKDRVKDLLNKMENDSKGNGDTDVSFYKLKNS